MKNKLNFITKSFLVKTFAVLMILGMMDSAAFSQTPTRISFARGKTSKTIPGTVNQSGRDYVIKGRRGQTMKIKVTSPQNTVALSVGGNTVGTSLTITLPSENDYEFSVYNNDQARSKYTLTVSIK